MFSPPVAIDINRKLIQSSDSSQRRIAYCEKSYYPIEALVDYLSLRQFALKFDDVEISNIDLQSPKGLSQLIIKYLCSEKYPQDFNKMNNDHLSTFICNATKIGMTYRQFNELLLLLDQDIVSGDFFNFFFKKEAIRLSDLKKGVIKFRAFAMLCFGNFRFAYKRLISMNRQELEAKLSPFFKSPSMLKREFKKRPQKMLEIEKIPKDRTWCLGYISGKKINKEFDVSGKEKRKAEDFLQFREDLKQMSKEVEETQEKALRNTDIYLTWDCMDIYFATSMRNKWEYEETYDFIEEIFRDERLKEFKLRYFDPTQSFCDNCREKGLIEGLMLKRARCTIYLAQESDTMGKDSELAATLAQSKPVIAYVPQYEPASYSRKIAGYPLDFFKKRLLILTAEESFEEISDYPEWNRRLLNCDPNFRETISEFLKQVGEYRACQPYELWTKKENEFRENCEVFRKICDILAIVECYNFDRRAELLRERHPLSMQVDLQEGIANGVLVVRQPKECAELLYGILTNELKFTIKRAPEGFVVLEEKISKSPFRVVVENEKLTNSFWNLFFSH